MGHRLVLYGQFLRAWKETRFFSLVPIYSARLVFLAVSHNHCSIPKSTNSACKRLGKISCSVLAIFNGMFVYLHIAK